MAKTTTKIFSNPAPTPSARRGKPTAPIGESKIAQVIVLLNRPQGAVLADLMTATGWQSHSVRGAISGALRKKRGLTVTADKVDLVTVYRIVAAVAQ